MGNFVQISDFKTGPLKISSTTFQEGTLQSVIDSTELDELQNLLGCTLYDLFIADYIAPTAGEFSEQRFIDIFDKFCEDDYFCGPLRSEGIKEMLKHFIYFNYIRVQDSQNRTTGVKKTLSENSENMSFNDHGLDAKYNTGVKTFEAIRKYICENYSDYPEYKGISKELTSWL